MCFADKFPVRFLLSVFPALFFGMCSRFDLVSSVYLVTTAEFVADQSIWDTTTEVLYLQPMILHKHFDIFPPDWGMLRKSRYVHCFLKEYNNTNCSTTVLMTVAPSVDFPLFRLDACPVSFMSFTLCLIAKL